MDRRIERYWEERSTIRRCSEVWRRLCGANRTELKTATGVSGGIERDQRRIGVDEDGGHEI